MRISKEDFKYLKDMVEHLPNIYAPEFCDGESNSETTQWMLDNGGMLFIISNCINIMNKIDQEEENEE
ncbi:hypothetical protein vBVpaMR16F_69 [Vibrio phage vB_VpaM_R16F]|nr:hypothetical protein vBVpaMR16F_69 [Vibrio phage vB_VpaM_R16F]